VLGECKPSSAPDAVLGQKCNGAPMDVVDYRDLSDFAPDPSLAGYTFGNTRKAVDPAGRVRRGYMFSSDEFADTGNVPSFLYDAGADPYEQVRFLESAYENRYILDSFRRNRVEFSSPSVLERTQAHYLDHIQQIAKTFAFGAVLDGSPTSLNKAFLADGNYGPLAMASTVAFDLYARILTRPEPGVFCDGTSANCAGTQPAGLDLALFIADPTPLPANTYDFKLGLGAGRYVHNDFDYSKGYWWADYQTQVGNYYDKIWATFYLSEAFDTFVSNAKEDFTDGRYKNVNFATVYPEQVRRLFANILTGDLVSFAPWATAVGGNKTPDGALTYPTWHDLKGLGTRPAKAMVVDPDWGFNEQLYTMGLHLFPDDLVAVVDRRRTRHCAIGRADQLARERDLHVLQPEDRAHLSCSRVGDGVFARRHPPEGHRRTHAGVGEQARLLVVCLRSGQQGRPRPQPRRHTEAGPRWQRARPARSDGDLDGGGVAEVRRQRRHPSPAHLHVQPLARRRKPPAPIRKYGAEPGMGSFVIREHFRQPLGAEA
jgi:hypothetical protein